MSGYLEVKYPFKNLGLNPFKSWKRQWCILRPSPTCSGGCLAVYCSEVGATAGTVDLPLGSTVRRAKSRTRPYAFAIFTADERKPRVLLAAQTLLEAQTWMEKIRTLLNGDKLLGTETLLKNSYKVSVVATELSLKCNIAGESILTLSSTGFHLGDSFVEWRRVTDVLCAQRDKCRICTLAVDSTFEHGAGELVVSTPCASELANVLKRARKDCASARGDKLSRSEGDLRNKTDADIEVRRSSWYSGPSEISLDDIDLVMSKECNRVPSGHLLRCSGAGDLTPAPAAGARAPDKTTAQHAALARDDSMSDRRSLLSVASGIYEEIPDLPEHADTYCKMGRGVAVDNVDGALRLDEPTYESVADCVYATMRRTGKRFPPPPLPPRVPFGSTKLVESWNSRMNTSPLDSNVTRHSSLGSLPRCYSTGSPGVGAARADPRTATLPHKKQAFSVFRKRLKSDSRIATSPKSDTSKENKDVETKKKKFDFAPTRDIFKNFKVNRKMKNLKITSAFTKGETRSCEFLDETEHVTTNRCSKSVECLEDEFLDEFDGDLSIEFNDDAVAALALPQEIVDLIVRGREQLSKICLSKKQECDYMPMSPVVPQTPIDHYMVMSPKTNVA